jgi:hypothetical protein
MSTVKTCPLPGALLLAALLSSCAHTPVTPPPTPAVTPPAKAANTAPPGLFEDPASACTAGGGKYLGDMKCQFPNGTIRPTLYGAAAQRAMQSDTHETPKSPRAWALATTAILFEINCQRLDMLAGTTITPDGEEYEKQQLSQGWGISNRDDLLRKLAWLQYQGHRFGFEEFGRRIDALTEQDILALEAKVQSNPQLETQLDVVIKNHRNLGEKSILAWDLIRYISLCRWGYLAGYFSQEETWDLVMPAALRLQQTFDSWQDLQNNYLIGREYSFPQEIQTKGARFRAIYERFLQDPASPWNSNPWGLDLKVSTPLPIKAN